MWRHTANVEEDGLAERLVLDHGRSISALLVVHYTYRSLVKGAQSWQLGRIAEPRGRDLTRPRSNQAVQFARTRSSASVLVCGRMGGTENVRPRRLSSLFWHLIAREDGAGSAVTLSIGCEKVLVRGRGPSSWYLCFLAGSGTGSLWLLLR